MVAAEFKQVNFQRPECALYVQSLVYVKYRQGLVAAQPPRAIARRATRSDRPTIEVLYRNRCQVNAFETADIDRRHRLALGIDGLRVRMDAAGAAEMVLDQVFAKGVGANTFVGREQTHLAARHEPQERAPAGADRAVAGHCSAELALDFECDFAAVAITFVDHGRSPCRVLPKRWRAREGFYGSSNNEILAPDFLPFASDQIDSDRVTIPKIRS